MSAYRLDLTVFLRGSLLDAAVAEQVRGAICALLPGWSAEAYVKLSRSDKRLANLGERGGLEVLKDAALRRGPTYRRLVEAHGRPRYDRQCGSAEMRSADKSVVVVAHLDEWPFSPLAGSALFGNSVTFQVCRKRVERLPAQQWVREAAATLAGATSLFYAEGYVLAEHDAYNMDYGAGAKALGKSVERCLPGLYWLNFFGKECVEAMGQATLLGSPACSAARAGDGVLLIAYEDPLTWDSESARAARGRLLSHIGPQFFFDRAVPDASTRSPFHDAVQVIERLAIA